MPINKSLIDAGAGVRFSGGTVAQATAVLHTNNVVYFRGGSAGLFLQNSDASEGMFLSNSYISLETSSTERLRITSAGAVGIGTSSPESKLHIVDSNASTQLRLNQTGDNDALLGSGTNFFTIKTGTAGANNALNILHSNQYVGIGTTTPSYKLDVVGEMRSDGYRINLSGGEERAITSTGTDSIQFGDAGVNEFKFKNAAGTSMIINSSGNVGIGTVSPAALLDVTASSAPVFRMYRSGTGQVWTQEIDSSGRWQLREAASSGGTKYTRLQVDDPGNVTFSAYGSGSFTGTAAYNLQVDSSGNIIESSLTSGTISGSGTATYIPKFSSSTAITSSGMFQAASNNFSIGGVTTPNARLSVEGSISIGTTSTDVLKLHNESGVGTIDGYSTRSIAFGSVTNGEVMRIDNTNGRVGIGTSSPSFTLDVFDTAINVMRVGSNDNARIIINSNANASATKEASQLSFADGGSTKWTLYKETNNDFYLYNAAASTYPIHAKAGGDIVLMEDGNKLGVGASSPARTLHVGGPGGSSGGIMISPTSGDAEIQFQDSGVTNAYITLDDGTGDMNFRDDSATVLTVDFSNERVGVLNASPQYALDVAGVIKGTSSIRVDAGSPYFGLYQSGTEKAYLQWSSSESVLRLQSDGAIDYNSGGLQKWTISGSEKMTLNTDGELGINQSNPRAKLEIYNTAVTSDTDYSASETPSGQDSIILYTGGTAENTYGSISWVSGGRRRAMITAVAENADTDYQGIAFYTQGTDGSGDFYESMRIKHSGQVSFYDYRGSNNTGTPTYLLGTDANGLMVKTNSGSDLPGGPYLPLTGGTLSGPLTIQDSIASNYPALTIYNTTNGGGNNIFFSDQTGQSQKGYLTFYHGDGSSQGGGATFQFHSTETDMTLQVGSSSKDARVVVWSAGSQAEVDYGFADDINTGMTRIGADQVGLIAGGNLGVYASTTAVWLKNSGNTKLATTGTGVTVTGGVTISGTNSFLIESNSTAATFNLNSGTRGFQFINNNATLLSLASDGYATFASGIQATNTSFSGTMNIAGGIYHIGDTDTFFGFIGGNDTFGLTTGGGSRMDANNAGVRFGGAGARIVTVKDEDDMAANSNVALATQQSIKAYVDNSISGATVYKGTWDPSSGTYGSPDLSSASLQLNGKYYICSANGSATPNGAGTEPNSWHTGDWVIWNDDLGSSGEWQKIDNSSVISGAGTGQKVVKWDGSGTSETIADGPITFNGDNSTFAGNITMANPLTIEGGSAQIILKDTSDDDDHSILFRSNVGGDDYKITTKDFTSAGLGDGIFMGSEVAEPLGLATNDTLALTIDESQNIGIGTTAPKTKLHVMGAVGSGSAATIRVGGEGTGNNVSRLELVEHVTGNDMNYGFSFTADGNSSNDLLIKNHDNSVTGNVSISIQRGNGYVGINQSSASEPLDVSGTARMDNGIVEGTIYVGDSVQHWGDGGTGMYFNTDEVLVKTASTTALTINSSQNASFEGDVNLTDYQSGTVTTKLPRLQNVVVESNPETKNEFVHPYLLNDLGNFKARGGTITFGGLSSDPTTSLNEPFKAGAKFLGVANSVISGSTWTITLTSTGDAAFHLNYGATVGICFGALSFAPSSCKIEINDANDGSGTWTTVLDSNQRDTMYVGYNSTGSSGARAIRYTLGKYSSNDPRITNIFAYNYSSQGMNKYFLPLEGGKIYGQLNTAGNRIINIGTPTASTDATTKAYVDTAVSGAGSGTFLPLSGGTLTGDVTFTGDTHNMMWDKSENRLEFWDNAHLSFGDPGGTPDLLIYHDGSHSYIKDQGTGHLQILSSQLQINSADNSENMATFAENGAVNLYHNGDVRFGTTSAGVNITGSVTASDVLDINGTGTSTFAGPISITPPSATGWQGLTITGSGTSHTQGAIVLKSSTSDTPEARGQGIFMFNEGDDSTWYTGTQYQDADTWMLGRVDGTSLDTSAATSAKAALEIYNNKNASFKGDVTIAKSTPKLTFNNLAGGGLDPMLTASGTNFTISTTSITPLTIALDTGDATFLGDILTDTDSSSDIGKTGKRWANIWVDNINGGTPTTGGPYLPLAGGTMTGNIRLNDNVQLQIGSSNDAYITHNGSNTYFVNGVGNLEITNDTENGDIIFKSDDGSNGTTEYFRVDGGNERVVFSKDLRINDGLNLYLGNQTDLVLSHNGTNSYISNYVGDLIVENAADGRDLILKSDNGSGGVADYLILDGSQVSIRMKRKTKWDDNIKATFGDGEDLEIYHDGTDSYIHDNGTGDLRVRTNRFVLNNAADTENLIRAEQTSSVELFYNNSKKFETTNTGVALTTGQDLAIGQYGGITIAGSYGTNGQVLKTTGSAVTWANPGSLLTAGTCIDISTNTINVDLTEASGLTDGGNVQEFIVNNTSGSTTPNKIAPANVDASQFNYRQIILTGAFYDSTNSSSTLFIPLGGSATESTSAYYYHAFVAPSAGRVKSIHMKHISGTTPTATSTRLQVWVDKSGGTPDYDSGTLSSSAAYYQTISADNINQTFAENNRVFFAFKKTTGSQYWYGCTVTIVVELTN